MVFFTARSEHTFARWYCKMVCDIWMGSSKYLHESVRVLVYFFHFGIRHQTWYQPFPGLTINWTEAKVGMET